MATSLTPYGFKPVNRLGNAGYNGAFSKIKIFANESTAIFNGDVTQIIASSTGRGHLRRCNTTVTATTVTSSGTFNGVFIGCEYTDPVSGKWLQRQYYPGSINAADVYGFVVDDPMAIFRCIADDTLAATAFGCNGSMIQTAVGSTFSGNSGLAFDASSIANTSSLPLRIVGFVNDPKSSVGDTYTEVYVRLNTHFNLSATGVANA